ncbi:MAG: hypothetical protein HY235_00535 [Acidobacteria bacterium]|nr:hypothetical protein [Acidobacteriota bacterium]
MIFTLKFLGAEAEVKDKEMGGTLAKLATALRQASGGKKQRFFVERRIEPRLWCSDLVQVWWKDAGKWRRRGTAVLEDISHCGACVQLELPLSQGAEVRIKHPAWKVEGQVRYCVYRDDGYFIGVLLREDSKWSEGLFRPKHLMDPARVAPKKSGRASGRS